jgi:hypothetical protein
MRKTFVLIMLLGPSAWGQPALPVGGDPSGGLGANVVPDGDGGYREDHIGFTVRIDRDGTIRFDDKATFDITDALMRLHGEDPYRHEKAAFMERTFEERVRMARADRTDRLHEAMARTPAYLDEVWTRTAWPSVRRRAALFKLWQEVAEDGNDEVVTTGRMVRATILAFIRRRMPEGSPDAFTRAEIEALNRRRGCTARFDPYR